MPALMTDFAAGGQSIAASEQSKVDYQKAQLQQQYLPQKMAQEMVQQSQATEMQKLQLQRLATTIKNEEIAAPIVKEVMSGEGTLSEKAEKLATLVSGRTGNIDAAEKILKLASDMKGHEATASLAKERADALKADKALSILTAVNPEDPTDVQRAILEAQTNGIDTKGFNQRKASGMPDAENLTITRHQVMGYKAAMAEREAARKEQEEKRREKETETRAREASNRERRAEASAQRAEAREIRADKEQKRKEQADRIHIQTALDKDVKAAHNKYLADYAKATNKEEHDVILSERDSKIEAANSEAEEAWRTRGYTGSPPKRMSIPKETPKSQPTDIPKEAVAKLKSNPETADKFDEIFGAGASEKILGKKKEKSGPTEFNPAFLVKKNMW